MESKRFAWRQITALLVGFSLLAGCNDIEKRPAQGSNAAATTGSNYPWYVEPPEITRNQQPRLPDDPQADPDDPQTGPNGPGEPPSDSGPQISGQPEVAQANEMYFFTPNVAAQQSGLEFSVQNLPGWADFDASTGQISGTPATADVGAHRGITISVFDGANRGELGPLDIQVLAEGDRSVTLVWQPPTTYDDGSVLTELGGYTIRFGRAEGVYDTVIDVNNPGLTSYSVGGLVAGTYFFATTAYDGAGAESEFSPVVSGKIP